MTFDLNYTQKIGSFSVLPAELEKKVQGACRCVLVREDLSYQLGPGQGDLDSFVLQTSRPVSHPSTKSHPTYGHRTYLERRKEKRCNDCSVRVAQVYIKSSTASTPKAFI